MRRLLQETVHTKNTTAVKPKLLTALAMKLYPPDKFTELPEAFMNCYV